MSATDQSQPETDPALTNPALNWREDGIPVSTRFDDPYFSLAGGLDETRHVFLAGNELPTRLRPGLHIAELGFGTGLNLLALAQMSGDVPLRYTSFEGYPMSVAELARAHATFPELADMAAQLRAGWSARQFAVDNIQVQIITGDVRDSLPAWQGRADVWFLDGFSPAKNPDMWSEDLMAEVGHHTAPGGSFATYTAAGHVRRALQAAGFEVTRAPGFAGKRHMSRGVMPA